MLKYANIPHSLEAEAAEHLTGLLADISATTLGFIEHEPETEGRRVDLRAHVNALGQHFVLLCEVKQSGQPRFIRNAALQLRAAIAKHEAEAVPVFAAPYVSLEGHAVCKAEGLAYFDFQGNCRLVFGGVFIERRVAEQPEPLRRRQKSIFKPKSAQILRLLLRDPARRWRVTELAEKAEVSLGQVSNIRTALIDREWATIDTEGLYLAQPAALLDAWREVYEMPAGERRAYYTTLHGKMLDSAVQEALCDRKDAGRAIFASFSSAQWLAPYARTPNHYFYADTLGFKKLRGALDLAPIAKGENVVITIVRDQGPLMDVVEPAPGIFCSSPVQTYLDLSVAGDRGREAADHLRRERLPWHR